MAWAANRPDMTAASAQPTLMPHAVQSPAIVRLSWILGEEDLAHAAAAEAGQDAVATQIAAGVVWLRRCAGTGYVSVGDVVLGLGRAAGGAGGHRVVAGLDRAAALNGG